MTKVALETAGSVWKILVNVGDFVDVGTTMFVLEVMKMEVPYDCLLYTSPSPRDP